MKVKSTIAKVIKICCNGSANYNAVVESAKELGIKEEVIHVTDTE